LNQNAFFSLILTADAKWKIAALIFLITAAFPVVVMLGMYRFGLVQTVSMERKEERLYPYMATAIFFFLAYYLIYQINLSPVYYYCLLGASILAVLTLLINTIWKISAHTISVGAVLGAFVSLQMVLHLNLIWYIVAGIVIGGVIGYARLRVGSHTQSQVYSGYLLGFIVMYGLIMYY
jgi:hypothetical protein